MINTRLLKVAFLLFIITVFSFCHCYAEPAIVTGSFSSFMEFTNGDSPNQLLWMIESNGTPISGPLQGPMAFVSTNNQDLWVADTQNARICLFSKEGKNLKEIDLLKLGKSAGLPNPPAIADLCFSNGKILAADAYSNSIIEINPQNNELRVFKANNESEKGKWIQISFVYSDVNNRIYIDDIVSGKIIILDQDGNYIAENVAACIGVNSKDSSMAAIRYSENSKETPNNTYQLLINKGYSTDWKVANNINNDNQIMNIRIIGIDKNNSIYVLYETMNSRYYNIYSSDGQLIKTIKTQTIYPIYNPGRPDWIDPSGNIYSVTISDKKLKIMKLNEN